MNIKTWFLSLSCFILSLISGNAIAQQEVSKLACKNAEYICCSIASSALTPTLKEGLNHGGSVFIKAKGCPAMFYHSNNKPELLFRLSNSCNTTDTPVLLNPSSKTNGWQFKHKQFHQCQLSSEQS